MAFKKSELNITKKCKACEINFDKLNKKNVNKDFHFPKDIPVSESMKRSVNNLKGFRK